jgi:hypothetical protein
MCASDSVQIVGHEAVTPCRHSDLTIAVVASGPAPGALGSWPSNPFTWISSQPGEIQRDPTSSSGRSIAAIRPSAIRMRIGRPSSVDRPARIRSGELLVTPVSP